jgi:hypothetical protein
MNTPILERESKIETIKPFITFVQEINETDFTNIDFDIEIQENNSTIKIKPTKILASNMLYRISIDGSKIHDIYNDTYNIQSIHFYSNKFAKIFIQDKNISIKREQSKTINVKTNIYVPNTVYTIYNTDRSLQISPNIIKFNRINWQKGIPLNLYAKETLEYNTSISNILFQEKNSHYKQNININISDKINLLVEKKIIFIQDSFSHIKIKLSKQPPLYNRDIKINITSSNTKILSNPSSIVLNRDNWNTYQAIKVYVSTKNFVSIHSDISLSADNLFGIKDDTISTNFTNKNISKLNIATIKILDITPISATIAWSFPKIFAYKPRYSIYLSKDTINYTSNLINIIKGNEYLLHLSPRTKYNFSIKANYTLSTLDKNNETLNVNTSSTYNPIQITTQKISLRDNNNNAILDDIENVLIKINHLSSINTIDDNHDNIPDILQNYTASIFNNDNFTLYDNYNDSDNDKMPDLLEVSIGRSPKIPDFNGRENPTISIKNMQKVLYLQHETTLKELININAKDGIFNISNKITAYKKHPCFSNNKIPYRIFTNDCKKLKLQDIAFEEDTNIYWVVFDDDLNIAYLPQTIKIFKAYKDIPFKISSFYNKIYSPQEHILFAFGKYAQQSPENNISIKFNTMNNIEKEEKLSTYKNNIFDFRVLKSQNKYVDVILPQIFAVSHNDILKIYKNNKWVKFNTKDGDKIYSSSGFNKRCNIADTYYTEGIKDNTYCIKIHIKDGSLNDVDLQKDNIITFTGGIAEKIQFIKFNTKVSSGCSSLNAKDINNENIQNNKIDPIILMMWLISLTFFIKRFIKKRKIYKKTY